VSNGGREYVDGTASGTTLKSGATEYVEAGGMASGTTASGGGQETVSSGGTINGAMISGGLVEIMSSATVSSGTIGFSGGGTLQLDDSTSFPSNVPLSGFGMPDRIDLRDILFASATSSYTGNTQSGTLIVSDGSRTANLLLFGQYTAASFHLSQDSATGTIVTELPASGDGSSSLAQLMHS
jgi:autotransporter passenger strand-loop-strand repeat protein